MRADTACDLMTHACDLLGRHGRLRFTDEAAVTELALARAELAWAAASCDDARLAGDLAGALLEVEALLERLERLPEPVPALTG